MFTLLTWEEIHKTPVRAKYEVDFLLSFSKFYSCALQ